jgi:hypothetical protein
MMFNYINAPAFDLIAVDLAEYSTFFQEPVSVRFLAYRTDGSIVTTTLVTDGIIDGTGPLADFQTFYFGAEFRGLTRVEMPNSGWSLDNLVVSVPEPTAGALLFTGIALACARRFRVKRE